MRAVHFTVKTGPGAPRQGTVNRSGATCIVCGSAVPFDHIRAEGRAGRMGAQLMAIVAEGRGGRIYLPPDPEHEAIAARASPSWAPETALPAQALGFRVQLYGMTRHRDLFTPRQLAALSNFSDLVKQAQNLVYSICAGATSNQAVSSSEEAPSYFGAIATYLAFSLDKCADYWNTIATWMPRGTIGHAFTKQALSMTWDFAEANPFSNVHCAWHESYEWVARAVEASPYAHQESRVRQADAADDHRMTCSILVSTDPPYYDNVPYADLSDFFYVWLRRSLATVYPDIFSTLLVPKDRELVADQHRHGGRERAQRFFEHGLRQAFARMRSVQHPDYPLTVFYAFKQVEAEEGEDEATDHSAAVSSTGWETMLEGLMRAGFVIQGTWPMRTERPGRTRELSSNALASSIVLVCRARPEDAPVATRREFTAALKRELPHALRLLQHGNIAPVDLAQAAIGPGMAIFSRYSRVLEADGLPMRVRTALALINQALDEVLSEQDAEYDADTRWAVAWFEQFGAAEGPFGVAETLSKAKNTSVDGLRQAGVLESKAGRVRLLRREELPADWNPSADRRLTIWETTQHLIRALERDGEAGAAALLARLPGDRAEFARDLAYRLYAVCERKGWAEEARAYNSLVVSWPEILKLAAEQAAATPQQRTMF